MNTVKQILICDDVADDALLLQTILLTDDCYVEIVNSGAAVLSFLETSTNLLPDLIILDVMMPKISGIDVIKHIRQSDRYPSIPILLVSALDRYDIENNIDLNIDGFIKKPINIDIVLTEVQKLLH